MSQAECLQNGGEDRGEMSLRADIIMALDTDARAISRSGNSGFSPTRSYSCTAVHALNIYTEMFINFNH